MHPAYPRLKFTYMLTCLSSMFECKILEERNRLLVLHLHSSCLNGTWHLVDYDLTFVAWIYKSMKV